MSLESKLIAFKYLQNGRIAKFVSRAILIYCTLNSFLAMYGLLVRGQSSAVYLLLPMLDFLFAYALYLGIKTLNNPKQNLLPLGKKERK